jgi:hypothetical protein
MIEIKSPTEFERQVPLFIVSLFLAGGVTGTPDWQTEMVAKLGDSPLLLLNPRREHFDVTDPQRAVQQIEWEYQHLRRANAVSFWFPKETLCPITLFEYGYWLGGRKPLFVGCDPEYSRRFDLEQQTRLERSEIHIVNSLDALVGQILARYGTKEQRQALIPQPVA